MAYKWRTALLLQENEELAETVRTFPCVYDKSKKEYKDEKFLFFACFLLLLLSNKITLNRAISSSSDESIFQMNNKL